MASVSKLKRMLDELRFKYQEKKRESDLIDESKVDSSVKRGEINSLLEEILMDIQKIDSYCYSRNRY